MLQTGRTPDLTISLIHMVDIKYFLIGIKLPQGGCFQFIKEHCRKFFSLIDENFCLKIMQNQPRFREFCRVSGELNFFSRRLVDVLML
jgi:hypothetical protein